MRFRDVRICGYNAVQTESASHRIELTAAQRYIDRLASISGTDISDWELSVFNNPASSIDNGIHIDKNKINACFFAELERLDKLKDAPATPLSNIPAEHLERVKMHMESVAYKAKKNYIEKSNMLGEELRMVINRQHEIVYERRRLTDAICGTRNVTGQSLVEQIDKIIGTGFWTLGDDCGSGYYSFYTPPITLFYQNEAQAADITVPMGRFRVDLNWDNKGIIVFQHRENLRFGDYIHPHVSVDGRICFGTMELDYLRAVEVCDYVKMMEFTRIVLSRYWSDNPYQYLYRFKEAFEAGGHLDESEEEEEEEEGDEERVDQPPRVSTGATTQVDRNMATTTRTSDSQLYTSFTAAGPSNPYLEEEQATRRDQIRSLRGRLAESIFIDYSPQTTGEPNVIA